MSYYFLSNITCSMTKNLSLSKDNQPGNPATACHRPCSPWSDPSNHPFRRLQGSCRCLRSLLPSWPSRRPPCLLPAKVCKERAGENRSTQFPWPHRGTEGSGSGYCSRILWSRSTASLPGILSVLNLFFTPSLRRC